MTILAIDPGNTESAFVEIDEKLKPLNFDKVKNETLLQYICDGTFGSDKAAIEMIASYGMPVGAEVFQTCLWIGRFIECLQSQNIQSELVYRKDVKLNLCGTSKAKDSNISQALKDRFGVVGVKAKPGWFYGFHHDIWAAYAVGVTYADKTGGIKP